MRSVAALTLGLALLAGCGSAPETIDPTGVDGLTVPTPSPDPEDFVDTVDNRWLPLVPGTVWTYEVSGARSGTRTVRVLDEQREVAGIETTVVRTETTGPRGRTLSESDAFYAQDTAGNVWILGDTGAGGWQAGVDDARATLAMAAEPRHGDGYPAEYVGGEVVRRAEVLETDGSARTSYGTFEAVVEVEVRSSGSNERTTLSYAPDVGLVEQDSLRGITLDLVEVTR